MSNHRRGFVAFVLLLAILCLLLTPLLTIHSKPARHHAQGDTSAAVWLVHFSENQTSFALSSTPPEKRALRSEALFELHCARIC